jgi:hypothetical protein
MEYFKYMYDLLVGKRSRAKIFGGGGVILPHEIEELQAGVTHLRTR